MRHGAITDDVAQTIQAKKTGGHSLNYMPTAMVPRTHRIGASDEYAADDTASCLAARDYKSATDLVVTTILGGEVTHASEDGTGRGTPVVAIRTAQTSSNGHGFNGETAYTLDGAQGQAVAVPIDIRQTSRGSKFTNDRAEGSSGGPPGVGVGEEGDPAYTVTERTQAVAIGISDQAEPKYAEECMPTLDAKGSGTRSSVAYSVTGSAEPCYGEGFAHPITNRAGDPGIVVFTERTRKDGRNVEAQEEVAYALTNPGAGGRTQENRVVVPTAYGMRRDHTPKIGADVTPALTANPNGGNLGAVAYRRNASCAVTAQEDVTAALRAEGEHSYQFIKQKMEVRRLTPREDERLQGFPDDWTRYGADGAEMSDSTRYKQMGNAVCVPVAAWIARRIAAVTA